MSAAAARERAPREARLLLSTVYGHILQISLLDDYDTAQFLGDLAEAGTLAQPPRDPVTRP